VDKYQVLMLLIVYYIVLAITTAVFQNTELVIMSGTGGWDILNVILGSLVLNIPSVPVIVKALICLPFYALLGYFIYLNLPKIAGSGSPQP